MGSFPHCSAVPDHPRKRRRGLLFTTFTESGIERTLALKVPFVMDPLRADDAERSLQELMPRFRAAGVQLLVPCFERRTGGVERLGLYETDVHFIRNGSHFSRMAALRNVARDECVDLVHTTLFEAGVSGRTAAVGTGFRCS